MKNYFKHFRFAFIAIIVLAVVYAGVSIAMGSGKKEYVRINNQCEQTERVFDYADKLTDEQEKELRSLIAEKEDEIGCDIVLVVVEDSSILSDQKMMNYADDFYDNHKFGYNEPWGDGALLLDNWARDELGYAYTWFSTSGRVENRYSASDIDELIDDVCSKVNEDPYSAYRTYVESLSSTMRREGEAVNISWGAIFLVAAILTIVYIVAGVFHNKGKKTTKANTYVAGGHADFHDKRDIFVTKHTTSRRIESSSGGGGGHHISSGGHSHGGGGGRH